MNHVRPTLAFAMGDPAGVGPQVLAAAWGEQRLWRCCRPFVIGSPTVMRAAVQLLGASIEVVVVDSPTQVEQDGGSSGKVMPCLSVLDGLASSAPRAVTSAAAGRASLEAVRTAADLAMQGRVSGVVTLPIDKAAWSAAGAVWPGHTELLAELCQVPRSAMMLYLPPSHDPAKSGRAALGVVHVTLHTALRDVPALLTTEQIVWRIRLLDEALRALGANPKGSPRLAVCALNPHAGEQGLFGDEELRIIAPAVEQARQGGVQVDGPLPADTLLMRAVRGEFDGVVAMYHDQGHIALKMLGVHEPVNITLGLPIVRTSVAHGTAYDLAWKHEADHQGLLQAAETAALLAARRTR